MKLKNIKTLSFLLCLLASSALWAQNGPLQRVEPLNWWVGMQNPELQLMLYGDDIGDLEVKIDYPGVKIQKTHRVGNNNYIFVDLLIEAAAKSGDFDIKLLKNGKTLVSYPYQLKKRDEGSAQRKGFDASDAIYLLMPDRFANGDTGNDSAEDMLEKADRKAPYGRHGGDLQGIIDHLDYIENLGFTALWLNPVLENNQPEGSYHGYSTTDYYQVDPRLGSNELYKKLVDECHKRGIKMIMDMVFNHCGSGHWWMDDLPMQSWINRFPEYTQSNHRKSTISDPHASQSDLKVMSDGWFVPSMPDLNLKNEYLLNYLTQNSIWWIEYTGLNGIRMDTYPYPDKNAMAKWMQRLTAEYPNFNVVGEVWINSAAKLAYWQKNAPNKDGYNSYLPSLMDFPLMFAITQAFNEPNGWDTGIMRLYAALADDAIYPDPMNMVVFTENHDVGRIYEYLKHDKDKLKLVIAFLATTRGIPQWYYGSELLMDGDGAKGHANIRQDFPGGWPGDTVNAFEASGRTAQQNELVDYLSTLLNYRKSSSALQNGKLLHFIPENGVYTYFRYDKTGIVMVMLNNSDKAQSVKMERFEEITNSYAKGKDIISNEALDISETVSVPAYSARIIELTKLE